MWGPLQGTLSHSSTTAGHAHWAVGGAPTRRFTVTSESSLASRVTHTVLSCPNPRHGKAMLLCWSKEKELYHHIHALLSMTFPIFWLPWFRVFGEGGQAAGVHVAAHVNVDGRIGFCELCWSRNALVVQWRCRRSSDQRSWHIGPTVLQRDKQV